MKAQENHESWHRPRITALSVMEKGYRMLIVIVMTHSTGHWGKFISERLTNVVPTRLSSRGTSIPPNAPLHLDFKPDGWSEEQIN